ncbi:MAG: glycosyltransferase [Roseburia sp.]|nr:glycosyltransferase [Roseburia sp.]MCM1242758.1 glycosyltransferase [Roseburia sp.]
MVIFLKGMLKTLDLFIDCMTEGMEDACIIDVSDHEAYIKRLRELDAQIDETTDVIAFNNTGLDVEAMGINYWEMKGVKFHNMYVDPPIWYMTTLEQNLSCMQIITVDANHKTFMETYFPRYNTQFLPLAGVRLPEAAEIPYEERKIDVLYVGARKQQMSRHPEFDFLQGHDKEVFYTVKQILLQYPFMTPEKAYDICMSQLGIELAREDAILCLRAIQEEVVSEVRGYYQGKVIESLAAAGIHVDIYCRTGWEPVQEKYPEYIHLHESVTPWKCMELMRESKITLNIQPWFKYGSHDRVYNAMLNGSVCVSDTSDYLVKYFKNGRDIVFYELENMEGLVKNVRMLLANPGFAKVIMENQKKAVEHSTWKERLQNILEQKFEEGKDFI